MDSGLGSDDHHQPARHRVWSTDEVDPRHKFSYYREAICKAFMDLTPELPPDIPSARAAFHARVESIGFETGALNRVEFTSHTIRRLPGDIAASGSSCYYLNLKLHGRCQINQAGRSIALAPGQVGIFSSDSLFSIDHEKRPSLGVASFWIPRDALLQRLPAQVEISPNRLSDHPVVGRLIAETARTLNDTAADLSAHHSSRLFDALLDLVAFAASPAQRRPDDRLLAGGQMVALRREIMKRLHEPDLSVSGVATALRMSERYVHKLFEPTGTTFSRFVMAQRLDGAACDLRDPRKAQSPIGTIAFDWGFGDPSHFAKAFKARFGCAPSDWRAQH